MSEKVLLTVEEAAARLSIGRTKAFELVAKGALQSVMIGRRRRVPVGALDHFVEGLIRERETSHPSATMKDRWSRTPPVAVHSESIPMGTPAGVMTDFEGDDVHRGR